MILKEQLKKEIAHIFESGANEVRIYNLIISYLENNRVDSIKIKKAVNILERHNQWQLCPKCAGQGKVWFPPNMPWSPTFAGDGNPYDCDVCAGKKVISTISGLPPS